MDRFYRILGILLFLRGHQAVSAAELAKRFEVSRRTIYRDVELLAELGVPVYAERGREGGFRLAEGYFLPPLMFSTQEATTLLMGLLMMRHLRVVPFAAALESTEHKLLTAMPDRLQTTMANLKGIICFEPIPADLLDTERFEYSMASPEAQAKEEQAVSIFLQAIFERKMVTMDYHSPYSGKTKTYSLHPQGLLWDRERWYLAGHYAEGEIRLWRADRVLKIAHSTPSTDSTSDFHIQRLMGRGWLRDAMAQWMEEAQVVIRLTAEQAEHLKRNWYYTHARYENTDDGSVLMTFGENDQSVVLELLRWLGPGAELIEPQAWRTALRDELRAMAQVYEEI
jgi:predicted DNA-binding transcriptional regulator YafY